MCHIMIWNGRTVASLNALKEARQLDGIQIEAVKLKNGVR